MFAELLLCAVGIVGEKEENPNNEEMVSPLRVLTIYWETQALSQEMSLPLSRGVGPFQRRHVVHESLL